MKHLILLLILLVETAFSSCSSKLATSGSFQLSYWYGDDVTSEVIASGIAPASTAPSVNKMYSTV